MNRLAVTASREDGIPVVRYEWVDGLKDHVWIILEREWDEGVGGFVGTICTVTDWRIQVLDQARADRLEEIQYWADARMKKGGWKAARRAQPGG